MTALAALFGTPNAVAVAKPRRGRAMTAIAALLGTPIETAAAIARRAVR